MASFFWILLSIIVFGVSIILTVIILIQDSKDTGLTSAFGGGGGNALMGARMQKDLAKLTAILAAILSICLFIMGFLTISMQKESAAGNAPPISPTEEVEAPLIPGGDEAPVLEDDSTGTTEEESSEPAEPGATEGGAEEADATEAEAGEAGAGADTEDSGGAEEKPAGDDTSGS